MVNNNSIMTVNFFECIFISVIDYTFYKWSIYIAILYENNIIYNNITIKL